jgi:hypothetical protein
VIIKNSINILLLFVFTLAGYAQNNSDTQNIVTPTYLRVYLGKSVDGVSFAEKVDANGKLFKVPTAVALPASSTLDAFSIFTGTMSAPNSAPITNSVAGGTILATTYYAKATCIDNISGQTSPSAEVSKAVASDYLLTLVGPSSSTAPQGCQGWLPYVGGSSGSETLQVATGHCTLTTNTVVPACVLGSTWTEPTTGVVTGAAPPSSSTAQIKCFWVDDQGNVNTCGTPEGFTTSFFIPGNLTTPWTVATWTLTRGITVMRVQAQATPPVATGCGTNAALQITDGTTPTFSGSGLAVTGLANDSGPISQTYPAGDILTLTVATAAAGCSTPPSNVNVVVQYGVH